MGIIKEIIEVNYNNISDRIQEIQKEEDNTLSLGSNKAGK